MLTGRQNDYFYIVHKTDLNIKITSSITSYNVFLRSCPREIVI